MAADNVGPTVLTWMLHVGPDCIDVAYCLVGSWQVGPDGYDKWDLRLWQVGPPHCQKWDPHDHETWVQDVAAMWDHLLLTVSFAVIVYR